MPTTRFSIMSIRPTPRSPASALSSATSRASGSSSPSSETGSPASKPTTTSSSRGGGRRGDGQREGFLGRRCPRVLEHAGLDRAAEQVVVDREGRLGLRLDRDAALGGVDELLVARPGPVAERGDDRHAGVGRLERELEAHLIVALAGAAVDDRVGAEVAGDRTDRLADHGPREGRHERVLALVERVREQRLGDLVARELILAVEHDHVVGAGGVAARDGRLEVAVLADVDEHGDHLFVAVVLLEPGDGAARIEPS